MTEVEAINAQLALLREIEREIMQSETTERYSWTTRANFAQVVQQFRAPLEHQRRRLVRAMTAPTNTQYPG